MVFQSYALYPHMSVRQNMSFGLKLSGMPKDTIRAKVEEVALTLGLTEHLDRKPAQLSGGQRQRVAMGRAIVRNPKAFLMDEPLSNLDAQLRVQMRTEISRLQHALNVTTVYVTHDQTEAMTLGDRVAVMSNGVLQQYASPNELYGQPANLFVAGFIGSPAMNLFDGTIADGAVDTALGRIPLVDAVRRRLEHANADRDVVVGIRPEHIFDGPAVSEADGERYGFDADLEVVESLGSDVLVHFPIAQPEMAVQRLGAGIPALPVSGCNSASWSRGSVATPLCRLVRPSSGWTVRGCSCSIAPAARTCCSAELTLPARRGPCGCGPAAWLGRERSPLGRSGPRVRPAHSPWRLRRSASRLGRPRSRDSRHLRRACSAAAVACCSSQPGSTTKNSSPPTRAAMSLPRTCSLSIEPSSLSTRSPAS